MYPTADHLDLAPPRQGRWLGPVGLALIAHGLLILALTWGVGWQRDAPPAVFEAEIWSQLPQQAAPRAVEPPPRPPTPPAPEPPPKPQPVVKPPPPPAPSAADIATEQAKRKAEADKLRREQLEREQKLAEKRAAEKAAAEKRAAAEKQRKLEADQLAKQVAEEKRREQARKDQIARMLGQAGATGGAQSTGTAQRSSGPSPGYAGRIAARIKSNVVFTEALPGNPRAEVEVTTLPDGSIAKRRIVKSSGSPEWDEAVLRAIDRTGSLPRDTDGTVPPTLVIGLRPLD